MSIIKKSFGRTSDGREASLYILNAGGITAAVTDFGAALVQVLVPGRDGSEADVVLGYDDAAAYEREGGCLGASVGPVANRTAGACFVIDGKEYHIPANEGVNNLHSDKLFYKRYFAAETGENSVTFSITLPDGQAGFPGNRDFAITYTVTEDSVRIDYHVTTDARTVLNPTNHSYFNLAGHNTGAVDEQILKLHCSRYTPSGADKIPTGELRSVEGTVFDFREGKKIGTNIADKDPELEIAGGGYDHNLVIDGYKGDGTLILFAEAKDPAGGRKMEALTDMPGAQFFTANGMYKEGCKGGCTYTTRNGFCLETQFFPDTPHHENFPSDIFGPDEPLRSTTVYRFSAE